MVKTRSQMKSGHSLGLMELANTYLIDTKGYFIGIEIHSIDINMGLSNTLQGQIEYISNEILNFII